MLGITKGKHTAEEHGDILALDPKLTQLRFQTIVKGNDEVELVFEYRGQEYTVKRNPEYTRQKERGTGTTTEKQNAELTLPDGSVITKQRDVDAKIQVILGLNREQFSQIAMIAQGDFQKLLTAKTKDRIDIFRKLFKTEVFDKLQRSLQAQVKAFEGDYAQAHKQIIEYARDIKADVDCEQADLVESARQGALPHDEILRLLESLIATEIEKEKEVTEQITLIGKEENELHGQVDAIKIQIDILAKQKIRKAALEDTIIPGKQGELGKASEAVSASEKELQDLNRQLAVEQERIDSLQKQLTFSSKEEAAEELKRIREKVISIENQIESAEKALNESKVKEAELSGTIKALAERLSGAEEADLKALEEENTELNARKEARNRELQRVQVARSVNESLHQKIGSTIAKLGDLQGKLTWMKSLSDTANGKLVGKDNILLETYVQMTYFDRIISRANVHLSRMSSGKYDLKRHIPTSEDKTGNAQIGLDLDVVDHYNGSERSVKTLSGGETFIASLSLALGLSEEIQASAGGIQLDTMFVDEGFGSLDEDTLNQAMSALTSLSDGHRLIGIISHVAELKSRIEKQIIVKKERSGGSSATIVLGS